MRTNCLGQTDRPKSSTLYPLPFTGDNNSVTSEAYTNMSYNSGFTCAAANGGPRSVALTRDGGRT